MPTQICVARARKTLAVLVVVLAALGACTSDGGSTTSTTTVTPQPAAWTGAGPAPRSRLSVIADRVLYLGGTEDRIELVALDPETGTVEWRRTSSIPTLPAGQRPTLLSDDDKVLALDAGALASIDAATGDAEWRTALAGPATSNPFRCSDAVCVVVAAPEGPVVQRFDLSAGTALGFGPIVGDAVLQASDDEVLSLRGDLLLLARDQGTEEVWRIAVGSLLDGAAFDPSMRWRAWAGRNGTWVVWTGPPDETQPGIAVGLAVTGAVLWRASGARICPAVEDGSARDGHDEFPVLLCFGAPVHAMAGIDPLTGAGVWQLDEPALEGAGTALVVRTSERSWVLHSPPDDIEIDIEQGPRRPGKDVVGGWCARPDPYPCALDGTAYATPDGVPSFAGVTAGGFGIWVQDGTVRASKPA